MSVLELPRFGMITGEMTRIHKNAKALNSARHLRRFPECKIRYTFTTKLYSVSISLSKKLKPTPAPFQTYIKADGAHKVM